MSIRQGGNGPLRCWKRVTLSAPYPKKQTVGEWPEDSLVPRRSCAAAPAPPRPLLLVSSCPSAGPSDETGSAGEGRVKLPLPQEVSGRVRASCRPLAEEAYRPCVATDGRCGSRAGCGADGMGRDSRSPPLAKTTRNSSKTRAVLRTIDNAPTLPEIKVRPNAPMVQRSSEFHCLFKERMS